MIKKIMKIFLKIAFSQKFQVIIYAWLLILGCDQKSNTEYIYPNNIRLSDPLGIPIDSTSYYFPTQIGNIITGIDTLSNKVHSLKLIAMNEPILYNFYLNTDVFRLTIMESWKPIKTIKFYITNNDVLVVTKVLNSKGNEFFPMANSLIIKADGTIGSVVNNNKEMKQMTFSSKIIKIHNASKSMVEQIKNTKYWGTKNLNDVQGLDGTRIILEGHTKDRYWFVNRWNPSTSNSDKEFKDLCSYLIDIAGEKVNW